MANKQDAVDPNEVLGIKDEPKEKIYKKFGLFEIDENRMGMSYSKKDIAMFLIGIVGFLLFTFVIRIPGLDVQADYVAGILFLATLWYVSGAIHSGIVSIAVFVLAYVMKIMTLSDLLGQIGGSAIPMLVPMLVLAYSITNTNLGQRIAFFALKKLGKSPSGLVLAFACAAAFLSSFVVNWPVIVILVPIATGVLTYLGEEPGKHSSLGAAIMAAILLGSATGGASLICGSGINPAAIIIAEDASNGAITISFLQWAILGIPFALIATPVCSKSICLALGINKNYPIKPMDDTYLNDQIEKLGKITPSEKRFIITLIVMMIGFLTTSVTGLHMYIICMMGVIACCIPGWGFLDAKKAFANVDWEIILVTVAVQLQGVLATNSGLGGWLVNLFLGWAQNFPMFLFIFTVVLAFIIIGFLTTSIPYAMIIPGLVTMCALTGMNAAGPILAACMATGFGFHIPWYSGTRLTSGPGYWNASDMLKAGWLTAIPFSLILAGVCTLLAPIVF